MNLNKKIPRLMLAAPKSGSGKTLITCGLLNALLLRNITCRSFKCGPDYIDPMFHHYVLGIKGGNLDTYFLPSDQVRELFINQAEGAMISVIEGVMGYYDGVGGSSTWASSYDVAVSVDAPVVLVLDGKGASLSLAAVVKGFAEYKENSHIKGVILNRTSKLMAERLRPEIEALGVKFYGYLPECEEGRLESRHLGLVLPEERKGLKNQLDLLSVRLEETLDIDGILKLAQEADDFIFPEDGQMETNQSHFSHAPVSIGVAKDEAFCFYYRENETLLKKMGTELVPFSPLHDKNLPEGISGLILGGGYPELYAKELSANESMKKDIKKAWENSMPILAECGGFLYLHEELETENGSYPMTGIIKAKAFPTKKLSRFGYIEIKAKEESPYLKKEESIRGHEFHYWDSTDHGKLMEARKPLGGKSWECIHGNENLMAGFPHLYYPSNPLLPERFLGLCRQFEKEEWRNMQNNQLEIVKGTMKELEELSELYDAVTGHLESHINYPGWRKGIYPSRVDAKEGIASDTLYVARRNGKIVGSLIINEVQEKGYETVSWKFQARPQEVAVIHTFLVHPDVYKLGIGKKLLEFAQITAAEEGKKVIRLDVYEENAPAMRLYEKMGYHYAGSADLGYGDYGLDLFKLYEKSLTRKEYRHD